MRRKSDGERRRGRAEGRSYRELFMPTTEQIGTRGKREGDDGGVGPLNSTSSRTEHRHRLNLLLSIFQLVLPHLHFTSTSSASYFVFSPYNTS